MCSQVEARQCSSTSLRAFGTSLNTCSTSCHFVIQERQRHGALTKAQIKLLFLTKNDTLWSMIYNVYGVRSGTK